MRILLHMDHEVGHVYEWDQVLKDTFEGHIPEGAVEVDLDISTVEYMRRLEREYLGLQNKLRELYWKRVRAQKE